MGDARLRLRSLLQVFGRSRGPLLAGELVLWGSGWGWIEQKTYNLWEKGPLMVKLRAVHCGEPAQ